ncbi:MAG: hypothetical protein KAT32_00790 [Candidatus Moranbacteria bacterium]|nr:hypothetical protein [Candidatus Moranbacteria bacterium]
MKEFLDLLVDWGNLGFIEFLNKLDPSHFQNVILGMLTMLVPIGVAVLSYFFEKRAEGKVDTNLELFILLKEILKVDKILFFSTLVLFNFIFYKNYFWVFKIVLIFSFLAFIIWLIWSPFRNIWKWVFESDKDFALKFLKKYKMDKKILLKSWESVWVSKGDSLEEEYTEIFCGLVNEIISEGDYNSATIMANVYRKHIKNRDYYLIATVVLPNLLKWIKIETKMEREGKFKEIKFFIVRGGFLEITFLMIF